MVNVSWVINLLFRFGFQRERFTLFVNFKMKRLKWVRNLSLPLIWQHEYVKLLQTDLQQKFLEVIFIGWVFVFLHGEQGWNKFLLLVSKYKYRFSSLYFVVFPSGMVDFFSEVRTKAYDLVLSTFSSRKSTNARELGPKIYSKEQWGLYIIEIKVYRVF